MALPEIIYIFLFAAVYFSIQWALDKNKKKRVLIVADDPAMLDHEFAVENAQFKKIHQVHAVRDLVLSRPDAVVIDYNYQDRKAGRQLFKVCQINKIPAIIVCNQADSVCIHPDNIIRKEQNYFDDIQKWLTRKVA